MGLFFEEFDISIARVKMGPNRNMTSDLNPIVIKVHLDNFFNVKTLLNVLVIHSLFK